MSLPSCMPWRVCRVKTRRSIWFGFSAWYCLYISSAVNPLIYYLRTNRFRSAFKQFLKDPFGSSDFKEKPRSRRNREEKRKVKGVELKKRDGETTKTGQIREVQIDVNQTKWEYSAVAKRNDRLILSINNLPAQDPCISVISFSWRKYWMEKSWKLYEAKKVSKSCEGNG